MPNQRKEEIHNVSGSGEGITQVCSHQSEESFSQNVLNLPF